jgi:hypothetical protein
MKLFLSDLWHDLREKRLWPVAVLLLVGLAAVPLVLAKPAPEPAPPPPSASAQEEQQTESLKGLARVVLAEDKAANGSKLNLFDPSNPFRPPNAVLADDDEDETEAPAAGDPGSVGESIGAGGGGGGTTTGGETGGGFGAPSPSPSPAPQPEQQTTKFTYVIDATFKRGDRTRKIKGMKRLEMLPNEESPLLLFLGVDANANNAVFLVDSRLDPQGEGACKPRPTECSFLYLGAGSEHMFTEEDGTTYLLRIDQIRRVKLKPGDSAERAPEAEGGEGTASKAHSSSKKKVRARATSTRRPFLPPFLADLVTVTEDTYEGSSSTDRGR